MSLNGILWLAHFFFPRECVHCGVLLDFRNRDYLCAGCRALLKPMEEPVCERCGVPPEIPARNPAPCPDCRDCPPAYRRARSALFFSGPGGSLVRAYKYSSNPYLAGACLRLLLAGGDRWYDWEKYDRVVPVPLHPRKTRERGFDQAVVLAAGLTRKTGIPLDRKSLVRIRYTGTQTRLDRKARMENIQGAFLVTGEDRVRGASILLIDDVHTTGATVNECAETLMKAGAENVDVLTLARAVNR